MRLGFRQAVIIAQSTPETPTGCCIDKKRMTTLSHPDSKMQPQELRASVSLASIFALRMLGLFLVLPVFSLEAQKYAGGNDAAWVGLAMGVYGLTQACLQLPLGMASDRVGRKPVMVAGLLVFALGSLIAALADSVTGLLIGRAVQGAGAISAAVTALLADQTRDAVRTKGMAMVGASIGLVFALAMVLAPVLAAHIGLMGIFALTAVLALLGIGVVLWWVPPEPSRQVAPPQASSFGTLFRHPALARLFFGVFVLHAVQIAMWVVVPGLLVQAGLAKADQWQVYLPTVLLSFLAMGVLFRLERRGHQARVLLGAIALLGVVQLGFLATTQLPALPVLALCLLVFFMAFNVLEASQPSLTSKLAPAAARGKALGVYNTLQSLGFFAGGALGGWVSQAFGTSAVFVSTSLLMVLWLVVAWRMPQLPLATKQP